MLKALQPASGKLIRCTVRFGVWREQRGHRTAEGRRERDRRAADIRTPTRRMASAKRNGRA